MLTINLQAKVGNFDFPSLTEISGQSSYDMFTDTCTLETPRKLILSGQSIAQGESLFNRGDEVQVFAGYGTNKPLLFQGFISKISPDENIKFSCQDILYKLKQNPVNVSYRSVDLETILGDIIDTPHEVTLNFELGYFRASNSTPAQILEVLRKNYGIQTWARNGKIYSGLAYVPSLRSDHAFTFGENIISTNKLNYLKQEDRPIKVKAISILPNNTKLETVVGDQSGELRTLYFYNVDSEAELKKAAENKLSNLVYEGYRGSFTTFGEPLVNHGDGVELNDPKYPDRAGKYLIDKVAYYVGMKGFRQTIYLGPQINS